MDGEKDPLSSRRRFIQSFLNPKLEIAGLLPTLTTRTKGSADVIHWLQDGYENLFAFAMVIIEAITLAVLLLKNHDK